MSESRETVIPVWPEALQDVDIVKLRCALDFISPCFLKPENVLNLGRILKLSGRQLLDTNDTGAISQWKALFQPALSADPVALRKHQKPAPAFVMKMPIAKEESFDIGDQLDCEVLFIGTGIPLIHVFLRSLSHLGRLGLVAGEGQFEVAEVYSEGVESDETLIWQQGAPLAALPCSVLPLSWVLKSSHLEDDLMLEFTTPTRLMVNGKPLRKPRFDQVFPFMLRRVTSMLYTHCSIELKEDMSLWVDQSKEVECFDSKLEWQDWRTIEKQGVSVGGFRGKMNLKSHGLEEVYWVLAVASLFGVGKGATYGAGQITLVN